MAIENTLLPEPIDQTYDIEPRTRLMLQALIRNPPGDIQCFKSWIADANFNTMDLFSLRLVPALFRKFAHMLDSSPHSITMRGIYRYFLFRNTMLFAEGHRVFSHLVSEGIDFLLFKGIAVSLWYHRNKINRPMGDIDFLINFGDLNRTEEILIEHGFSYMYPDKNKHTDIHSHDYVSFRYNCIDLHWHSLLETPGIKLDKDLWNRARYFDWNNLLVKIMSPEDLILTGIINGVRDEPVRPQWIYDIICIVAAEREIDWEIIWSEAKARQMSEKIHNALNLIQSISAETIPNKILISQLNYDESLRLTLSSSALHDARPDKLVKLENKDNKYILTNEIGQDTSISSSELNVNVSRFIRYLKNESGDIEKIFLQTQFVQRIADCFGSNSNEWLEKIINAPIPGNEAIIKPPEKMLYLKQNSRLPEYKATLNVLEGRNNLNLSPGEAFEIKVMVQNNSSHCWLMCRELKMIFGLSYHLLSEDGSILLWDLPRSYFSNLPSGYLSFIEPSQEFLCELIIYAPLIPGRYIAQLDIVHEYITWFSNEKVIFPKLHFVVGQQPDSNTYEVSSPAIVYDTFNSETIIINTLTGVFYSANNYASIIWSAILNGYSIDRISNAFISAGIFGEEQGIIHQFVWQLLTEGLICAVSGDIVSPGNNLEISKISGAELPILKKFTGNKKLASSHPVHGCNDAIGWPYSADVMRDQAKEGQH